MKKNNLKKLMALATSAIFVVSMVGTAFADTEEVTLGVTAGSLSITAGTAAAGTNATGGAAITASTATVTDTTVTDYRGSGAGWTATSDITAVGIDGGSISVRSVTNTGTWVVGDVTATGFYNGTGEDSNFAANAAYNAGEWKFTIEASNGNIDSLTATDGDALAIGAVDITGVGGTPGTNYLFTVDGLSFTLNDAKSWVTGDVFGVTLDFQPPISCTITPSGLAANSGTAEGITTPGADTMEAAVTEYTAAVGAGMGEYTFDDALSCDFHANSMAGTYKGTITYSVS